MRHFGEILISHFAEELRIEHVGMIIQLFMNCMMLWEFWWDQLHIVWKKSPIIPPPLPVVFVVVFASSNILDHVTRVMRKQVFLLQFCEIQLLFRYVHPNTAILFWKMWVLKKLVSHGIASGFGAALSFIVWKCRLCLVSTLRSMSCTLMCFWREIFFFF